jgi:ElaB/YqjD/DUF883 family membrane-anchored ribosome-binding protein
MNAPRPTPFPQWLSISIVVLLAAQVGLLWTHGSLLQRQHEDIQDLREDVQSLADDLYQDPDGSDSGDGDAGLSPARLLHHHRRRRPVRAAWAQAQGEPDDAARQELEASRQSGRDAVAKARKVQDQVSWSVNAQKAEDRAKAQETESNGRTWMWLATGVAAAALMIRLKLRRRA